MFKLPLLLAFIFGLLTCQLVLADDSTPEVEVVGNKFYFKNNGSQFLMRGIAYQQNTENSTSKEFVDPLADGDACKRDVEYLQKLNTNTLRVYALNHSKNHDECMKTFADAGIYIIADLSEPELSINRDSPSWDLELYERYTGVVDQFANYSNVLGFFAGNEVTNNKSNTDASAFVKAAIRDTKKYISDKNYRDIPVGYSSNDDEDTRIAIADYFSCGDLDERADFFGINNYEWCGDSSFKSSGYEDRTKEYKNLTIPVFFSEYGCNAKRPRKFTEVGTIFSDDMTDVWSGGIVYMYFEEANKYGLVSADGDDVKTLDDFKYYSSEINKISPSYAKKSSVKLASSTLSCPASASTWKASSKLPPTPDKDTCDCMSKSLECVLSDDVDEEDYGDLYGTVCGDIDCDTITADGEKGKYGAFSYCSSKDKLSYILNAYYEKNGKKSSACDFKGSASINKKASADKSCSSKISQATKGGSSSTGSSSGSGSDSSSGSGSGSGSSSGSGSDSTSTKLSSGNLAMKSISKAELLTVVGMVTCFVGGVSFVLV